MVFDSATLQRHGVTPDEYARIVELVGREPNLLELGLFSVMWSEHCSYKSSRVHLKTLPTEGARVVQGPGENAGAVDIGDGLAAVFKIESHNHPSFIEPYQGAATGVGGIIRDIFTMGARPIALLDSLRFGPVEDPANRRVVRGVVAGIGGYGNSMGIPTIGGKSCSTKPTAAIRWSMCFVWELPDMMRLSKVRPPAPVIPCTTWVPRPDAMVFMARRWHLRILARILRRSGQRCRWATPSRKSC